MLTWLLALHGAANLAVILDPSALLKKRSPTRGYGCYPVPHRCGDQEACQVNVRTCAGSLNYRALREWQVRMHGAFTIPFDMLGIRHIDQSCHHEVWVYLLHVNARLVDRVSRDDRSRPRNLKKRSSPYDHSKEKRRAS